MKGNPVLYKILVVGIIVLFIVVGVQPAFAIDDVKKSSAPISNSNTLYVGGSGEGNYTKIQDAVDDATNGDTVFVFNDSSPYYENVWINQSINLIGEDKYTTIIDSMCLKEKNSVTITVGRVQISGFTLSNSSRPNSYGVEIYNGNETIITNNIFNNNNCGIFIYTPYHKESHWNIISNNIINNSDYDGIIIGASTNNLIKNNTIKYTGSTGISINYGENNLVTYNDITYSNGGGISLWGGSKNKIIKNNFYMNRKDAFNYRCKRAKWNGNYWGEPRIFPKILLGIGGIYLFSTYYYGDVYLLFPKIEIDWFPAKEPYDIEV